VIAGFSKLRIWMQADGADDIDVFTRITKLDAEGRTLFQDSKTFKYSGPDGMLRASHRRLDEHNSTPAMPVHLHRDLQPLSAGDIVPLDVAIWPTGLVFHSGEQLRLTVAGYDNMESRPEDRPQRVSINKGWHVIHTGGARDSYLLLPVVKLGKLRRRH
jgi:uncharacterized protein